MHAVFVTPYFSPKVGGLENYALQISFGLFTSFGWKISVITSNHLSKDNTVDVIQGITVYRLRTSFKLSNTPVGLSWGKDIEKLLIELKPDILNAHTPVPYISDLAVKIAHKRGIPTVLTYQNDIFKENIVLKAIGHLYYKILGDNTLRMAQKIVVSSEHYAAISPHLQLYKKKIVVIPPGIHLNHLVDKKKNDKGSKVLFVAQLDSTHRHKGLEFLFSAVAILDKKCPDLSIVIIGTGNDKEHFKQLSKELGISDNVTFEGYVSDEKMPQYFADALCLCLPSTSQAEGFGMVILEAAAQKTPSIGTNVGGIPAVIIDNETGILVPAKNGQKLADAIARLYEDKELRDELGYNAYKRVNSSFTWERQIKRTNDLFNSILKV